MDKLSLANAIRLGSMLHPQGYHRYVKSTTNPDRTVTVTATCALGAAAVAIGKKRLTDNYADSLEYWHSELSGRSTCPVCPYIFASTRENIIAHLNDHHKWTREDIADWVDQDLAWKDREPVGGCDETAVL